MQLLEIFTPGIDIYVQYKVLDPYDVEALVQQHSNEPAEEYTRHVLENVIYNLKSTVTDSLKKLDKDNARAVLDDLYNGCIMLNPGFDVESWRKSAYGSQKQHMPPPPKKESNSSSNAATAKPSAAPKKTKPKRLTRARFLGLEAHLKSKIIGQDDAIGEVVRALKRQVAGLGDDTRPLGVFLFAGASGVGKTELAKQLHSYLFGEEYDMVRIDCGEYQQKHENQKLLGAPPGYLGHDNGGHLTNQMLKNPHTVLLLDEVEKAHADLWDTFLRVFDEGMVTDGAGKSVSFRDAVIIMTTNLGNAETVEAMIQTDFGFGKEGEKRLEIPRRTLVERHARKAIRKSFRPEFLNRIDKVVVFNHLSKENLREIARLECQLLESKISRRGMSLTYSDDVLDAMVAEGVTPIEGARGLSRVRREKLEDVISDLLLASSRWPRGSVLSLHWDRERQYWAEAKKVYKRTA